MDTHLKVNLLKDSRFSGTISKIGKHKISVQPDDAKNEIKLRLGSLTPLPSKRFAIGKMKK